MMLSTLLPLALLTSCHIFEYIEGKAIQGEQQNVPDSVMETNMNGGESANTVAESIVASAFLRELVDEIYEEIINDKHVRPKGVWGDSETRPKGVWGDSESRPKGVWGDSEDQPKGIWGDSKDRPKGVWGDTRIKPKIVWGER